MIGGDLRIIDARSSCSADESSSDTNGSFAFGSGSDPVARLCAVVKNPVSEQFEQYRERTEVSFALFVALLLVTLGVSLHRLILRPLHAIREGICEEEHTALLKLSSAKTEFGTVARLVIEHTRAIHERTQLQAEVARAGKLASLGVVGAMVAHELNNPLAVVLGYADMLSSSSNGDLGGPENREAVQAILSHAERMRRVVDAVRSFSWEERKDPERRPEDLNHIVTRSLQLIEPELRRAGIRLELRLDHDLPRVSCDHVQIETVLQNLVGNAREAIEKEQPKLRLIEIVTHASETDVELVVSDSGPGITDTRADEVFVPFVSSKLGKGSGLGLAISTAIAKEHRGGLRYQRSRHGGASFQLRLPRSEAA